MTEMYRWQTHLELREQFPNWGEIVSTRAMGAALGNSLHVPLVGQILKNIVDAADL